MTRVAVVGLGAMGVRIAARLLGSGRETVVWNRTAAKAEALAASGAVLAASPREAAADADAVITMVSGPEALRAVTEGPEGIAATDNRATVIEMSTVGPAALLRLASVLPEDVPLLDAPVLGSLAEAEAGALRIVVGGPEHLCRRWEPLLSLLGTPVHVGPLGAGAAAKLVANATLLGVLGVFGEALALAQGLGLSREKAFEVLTATALAGQVERRRAALEAGDYSALLAHMLTR